MPNNINNQGYDYYAADKSRIVIRVLAFVILAALSIFLWQFSQSNYAWKNTSAKNALSKHKSKTVWIQQTAE